MGLRCGVPVHDGLMLPNDWAGEWGGVAACVSCFAVQHALTEPVTYEELRRRSGVRKAGS